VPNEFKVGTLRRLVIGACDQRPLDPVARAQHIAAALHLLPQCEVGLRIAPAGGVRGGGRGLAEYFRGKTQLCKGLLWVGAALRRNEQRAWIAWRQLQRLIEPLCREPAQQYRLDGTGFGQLPITRGLQQQGLGIVPIMVQDRLQFIHAQARGMPGCAALEPRCEQRMPVGGVRKMVMRGRISLTRRKLRPQAGLEVRKRIHILGLVRIDDLRLQIAARLSCHQQRHRQQQEHHRHSCHRLATRPWPYNIAADNTTAEGCTLTLDLIDIGANLTHESFAADRPSVMERAQAAGVRRQIVTGADLSSSQQAASLAAQYPQVLWSTAGVHPHLAAGFEPAQAADLRALLEQRCVVAVGECGLDYYRDLSPRDVQRSTFIAQLDLAVQLRKPVFLHQRDAHRDFVAILRQYASRLAGGVAHCFTGGPGELNDYLQLGLCIGVTGWLCDERRGGALREALPLIPADRVLLETDAPYLLPRDLVPRPATRRNEPAFLLHILRAAAALRGEAPQELAAASTENAERLFRLTCS
jgi:TatD DNase family protein